MKRSGKSYHGDKDEKATVDDDTSGNVLKLLGEDGLRTVTQLIDLKSFEMWFWRRTEEISLTNHVRN